MQQARAVDRKMEFMWMRDPGSICFTLIHAICDAAWRLSRGRGQYFQTKSTLQISTQTIQKTTISAKTETILFYILCCGRREGKTAQYRLGKSAGGTVYEVCGACYPFVLTSNLHGMAGLTLRHYVQLTSGPCPRTSTPPKTPIRIPSSPEGKNNETIQGRSCGNEEGKCWLAAEGGVKNRKVRRFVRNKA
nr:hypothetical protein CFP56_09501 [Quercus suber]